jgi:hypothetical protein
MLVQRQRLKRQIPDLTVMGLNGSFAKSPMPIKSLISQELINRNQFLLRLEDPRSL